MRRHGAPLVEDPERVGDVIDLGIDETAWLAPHAHPSHPLGHRHSGHPSRTAGRPLTPTRPTAVGSRPTWTTALVIADPFQSLSITSLTRLDNRARDGVRPRTQKDLREVCVVDDVTDPPV